MEEIVKKDAELDFWALVNNTATVGDVGEEQKAHYIKVKAEGIGICSKCRWTSGCMNCDVEKAWVYVLKWQLGLREVDLRLLRAGGKKAAEPVSWRRLLEDAGIPSLMCFFLCIFDQAGYATTSSCRGDYFPLFGGGLISSGPIVRGSTAESMLFNSKCIVF
jgi:hypothetical protein